MRTTQATAIERRCSRCVEAVVDQVITIPQIFVTGETEEMIGDSSVGGGGGDLTHNGILSDGGCGSRSHISEHTGDTTN